VDASAIRRLQHTDLEQAATKILQRRFSAGLDDLVWSPGIPWNCNRCIAVETSTLAFLSVHSNRRVLVERAYAHANGVCDARRICFEKYALRRMSITDELRQ
jgi:hypothetical protein